MTLNNGRQTPESRILNRFYLVFAIFGLLLLFVGVPFVFVKKLAGALSAVALLSIVVGAWYFTRRGYPKRSLLVFSGLLWILMVGLLFAGLSSNSAAIALAVALMLSVVVSQRAGLTFALSYIVAWLVYIVLGFYGLAAAPFFPNVPLTGWLIVAGAVWLFLIPVPELVKGMHLGAAVQRSIFEATSDALLVVDLSGRLEVCNQRFIDMWRIAPDLIAARSDSAMLDVVMVEFDVPTAFRQRISEIYSHAAETSSDTLLLKDGRVIERHSQPNSVGRTIVGRVWSFRDVTSSQHAQSELRSSQAKLQGLFDLSPLGMARNGLDGRFHEVNAAFIRMLGYPWHELKAMSYWDITPPRFAAQEKTQLDSLATRGTYGPYEKEYIHQSGHTFPVRLSGMLIRDTDDQPFIWSIIEDISEQKAHERTLTEARKTAEDASTAKGDFLANMSHEIRTPMNAILGMMKLLGHTPLTAKQLDYLGKAEGAAASLLGLINDILDLSKIDSGKMELDVHRFKVMHMVQGVEVVLGATLGGKKIDLQYTIDPHIPEQLVGDALRLQQVLINLGGNAIKFTDSGTVVVALRLAADGTTESDAVRLEFAVEDTGIGIAPENQAKIFSEFSQAESSTTRRFGGTGLGLAISKRIVEMMGGQLALRSELGVGSQFSFVLCLPVAHADAEPGDGVAPQSTPAPGFDTLVSHASKHRLAGMRILLVEDNAINQQVAQELLGFEGALVSIAGDGQQGVETLAANPAQFDVVLMDVQMPRMDGYAATQAIRNVLGLITLPIIGLTANAMASDRAACLRAGMNEHVGKPFDMAHLVSLLITLTGRQSDSHGARQGTPNTVDQGPPPTPAPGPATLSSPSADIDLPKALARMGGMRALYVRSAEQFQDMLASLQADLHQNLEQGDVKGALLLLHSFKSNAATMGLDHLSAALAELEQLCKVQVSVAPIQARAPSLLPVIAAAQVALRQAVTELGEPMQPDAPGDPAI